MKFIQETATAQPSIHGYEPGRVSVRPARREGIPVGDPIEVRESFIIGAGTLTVGEGLPAAMTQLNAQHLQRLLDLDAELLLIGTGERLQFPPLELLRPIIEAQLGYEVMDSAAACRTYNALVSDGRKAVALVILEAS